MSIVWYSSGPDVEWAEPLDLDSYVPIDRSAPEYGQAMRWLQGESPPFDSDGNEKWEHVHANEQNRNGPEITAGIAFYDTSMASRFRMRWPNVVKLDDLAKLEELYKLDDSAD